MPRFHFDVVHEGIVERDDAGVDFPNLAAAVDDAKRLVADLAAELTSQSDTSILMVQIRDGEEYPLVTVLMDRPPAPQVVFHRSTHHS